MGDRQHWSTITPSGDRAPAVRACGAICQPPTKAGRDAGELCGLSPVGIKATSSLEEVVALDADCVLYMRQGTDIDELCALLASGKNVVTTRGDFHHPASLHPDIRAKVEAACMAGGTSVYSTGSSPGFSTEALLLPLLSLSRRLDCLTIEEYADLSSRNSPDLLFNIMGFGAPPRVMDQGRADHVKQDFAASLAQIADAVGLECDDFQATGEVSTATARTEIAAGVIDAGMIAAQRITVTGLRGDKPVIRFRANWYCTQDITHVDWDLRDTGWRVRVAGDTPLDVNITFPVAPENFAAFTPGLTAHRAVNAIPAVCEAAPGIRTTVDLPQVIPLW